MKTRGESLVSSNNRCVFCTRVQFLPLFAGQFFRRGVKIDENAKLLYFPGRPPVPVVKQDLWKFMEHDLHEDSQCWTSVYHSSQGAGLIAGSYEDYIVDDLLAVGR